MFDTLASLPATNNALPNTTLLSTLPTYLPGPTFNAPTNLAAHDLTRHIHVHPTLNFGSLLGLSLKFCPWPRYTTSAFIDKTISWGMRKDLYNKCAYTSFENNDFDPYLYSASNHPPPEKLVPTELKRCIDDFATALQSLFKKWHSPSNLLPHQRQCLETLHSSCDLVVCHTDKSLGPALLEHN